MEKSDIILAVFFSMSTIIIADPTVHVFGDSHALHCFSEHGNLNYIFTHNEMNVPMSVYWISGKTMHGVGKDGLKVLNFQEQGVREGDIVLLIHGEVDVRFHIAKQRDEYHRNLDEILETLVNRYIIAINQNKALYQHIHCLCMEVMPPSRNGAGMLSDRILITQLLNAKLHKACLNNQIFFLPTHDLLATNIGTFRPELSMDDRVHLAFDHNYILKQRLINFLQHVHLL